MNNEITKEFVKNEWLKWQLTELTCQEPDDIESNELEIHGEDDNGREGTCTVNITDIAKTAHDRIIKLEKEIASHKAKQEGLVSVSFLPVSKSTYKTKSVTIHEKSFLTSGECKNYFDKKHDHDDRFCRYCHTEWFNGVKEYTDDDVHYELICKKITTQPPASKGVDDE